nr:hypothetical protein [Tanacetum cinerariifolium]
MCDKKNSVLFTEAECLVLSPEFKLPDENQVLLKVPRENNMYNVDLKNIVPSGDLTCFFAKETLDESNLWHRRLGHINFKTMNKLVKGNLLEDYQQRFLKIITHVLLVRRASNIEPLVRPNVSVLKGHFARECRSLKDPRMHESDCESWPPSNLYDRFQPSGGYHVVPPPYIGTFMPPKPDLVFHTPPTAVETNHLAFNVQLSPTKPEHDLSHTTRPSAPIIEDWVSNSEEESQPETPQVVPSFAQSSEHVKSPRHSVQPIEAPILAATPAPASLKSNSSGKRRNMKSCFVYKSVDHLIKDCDFHTKKMARPTQRNYAPRGIHKQYAPLIHSKPQKHTVPPAVLTQSKPVSNTVVRPVSAALPSITATRPRYAHPIVNKSKSPIRRHITHNPSSKTSNSPPRVTAAKALVVSVAQGKQGTWGNPQQALKDKGVIDSGCSRHMTENMSYLSDFEELNEGYVAFGGNPKAGKITGKGKIKTCKLDFDDVYFVNELKFNLFSVSQMCDKKNIVLFTDTECLVLSSDFKLPDESQVLLRVPRENNMYNVNLKNIVPSRDLTCLFAKATIDESNLWHRRLCHINFKTINKLVKENQLSLTVKVIRSDNETEFKNSGLNQFFGLKGIKQEFSVPRTPQQNGIAERKNRTLIKAARTMLAYSLLPIPFWTEAVNTACYVDEGFLVGYFVCSKAFRVFNSRTRIIQETLHVNFLENKPNVASTGPTWLFDIDSLTRTMNYQPVTAGNQTNTGAGFQDKFDAEKAGKEVDQTYVLFPVWSAGSTNPKNNDKDVAFDGKEHDVDAKKPESVVILSSSSKFEDFSNNSSNEVNAAGSIVLIVGQNSLNNSNTFSVAGPSNTAVSPTYGKSSFIDAFKFPDDPDMPELEDITYSDDEDIVGPEADFNNLESSISKVWVLVDHPYGKRAIGTKWVYRNKKDERCIVIRNKARLVAQGHTQEEGINYKEVFAPVARIKAIRLFLAYASFMGFMVYQMDVKSAFLYGTIKEEVFVCQPLGFEDPDHSDKVYKVVKALYGLHQAPRAWYEILATYLLENGFQRGTIDQTLFIKKQKEDILLVKQKKDGIFISQDKYVAEILRKFGLTKGKSASTPIDTEKPLLKDPDGEDVDTNDVTRLQALVDKKKVVITEATIREALRLGDDEGVDCLPNDEIFAELARMGYEKPSTKLTFYKAFFSSQWKFLIHTILQSPSRKFNFSKYIFESLVRNVDNSSKFYMYPRFIQLIIQNQLGDLSTRTTEYTSPALTQKVFANMRRVGKGFSGVETPLFEGMLVVGVIEEQGDAEECVEHLEDDKVAEALEITKLKTMVKKLERVNKVKVLKLRRLKKVGTSSRIDSSDDTVMEDASNPRRMIDDLDRDAGVVLMDDKEAEKKAEKAKVAGDDQVQGRQAEIYQIDIEHTSKVLNMQEDEPEVQKRRKGVVIRDPEEESTTFIPTDTKSKDKGKGMMDIDWDVAIEHVKQKAKEDPAVQRYQVMKKRPQTKAQARKNMITYLKNVVGFRLDYFKGMSYDDIRPIFEVKLNSNVDFLLKTKEQIEEEERRIIQSINKTPAQKTAKRRKLNEEVEDLKQHLEIVPDEDDDVYTEATPLARKVPVVDYEIIHLSNKPHYKIIRADGTHQLYMDKLKYGRIRGLPMVKQGLRAGSYWNRVVYTL